MFKHRFPLQDDQVVMVTLFFIDTVHLAGFPKFLTRGSNGGSRCGPDDFSATQILEAKVAMKFPLSRDLSSPYRE